MSYTDDRLLAKGNENNENPLKRHCRIGKVRSKYPPLAIPAPRAVIKRVPDKVLIAIRDEFDHSRRINPDYDTLDHLQFALDEYWPSEDVPLVPSHGVLL